MSERFFKGYRNPFPMVDPSFQREVEVKESQICLVLGGSGMGKSILFKTMLGIESDPMKGSSQISVDYSC